MGKAERQRRHEGQDATHADEQDAGHQPHMEAGYGEQVGQSGIAHGGHGLLGYGAAVSRHQSRRDGARDAAQAGLHPSRDALAGAGQAQQEPVPCPAPGRGQDQRRAEGEADASQLPEKGLALEVEGAGRRGR